ncbi:MAG TPA: aminopeptidase family protein P, partial [Flavobacteriaceae bacterium]|nr:aminopeptidase family protein P [Flavobacteriaceae bacterium]
PTLIDDIWVNRPLLPSSPVIVHPLEFSGETTASKLQKVKDEINKNNADYYFIAALDEIAWLFNIRSNDVDFTPLVISYALVGKEETFLFCDVSRFEKSTIKAFQKLNISIIDYTLFFEKLPKLTLSKKIITDAGTLNYATFKAIEGDLIFQKSIVQHLKANKNEVELENTKKCMVKDGVAMVKFFRWLDAELEQREISEYEIGNVLESFRKEQAHYQQQSFSAIVGYKGNGAIIHYTAPKEGSAMVKKEGILLIDSGAQYSNGTTDVTRTVWLGGNPTDEIKAAYTAVLKGYIELETMQFPKGTVGMQLDAFARMHLWRLGLNFPHGTGHGIGSYGMVHEAAQGFAASMTTTRGSLAHEANQLTTIEPGCYKKDKYGIRTENVVVSKFNMTTEFGEFLGFEPLTLYPIDTQLLDFKMMHPHEIKWLNQYHSKVYNQLSPHLDKWEKNWLKEQCKPI